MPQSVKAYSRRQGVITALGNMVINPALAWLLNRGTGFVPLAAMVVDTAITSVIIAVVVSWLAAAGAQRDLKNGNPAVTDEFPGIGSLLGRLPRRGWALGLLLGLGTAAIMVPLVAGSMVALGYTGLPVGWFMVLKAVYTGPAAFVMARWAIIRQVQPEAEKW